MKYFKRYSFIFFAIVILFSLIPFHAFADPVTASVIANAFAQAIASYGAANGVALTFDVSSTDGIGETVHELWKDFREGTQTADDYATIAQAIFPELYYKSSVALGTASDVYAVGVHISDTYAETLDEFYNWLLSGPAEMVQVDNQYYQFSDALIGSSSSPIIVGSVSSNAFALFALPVIAKNSSTQVKYQGSLTVGVKQLSSSALTWATGSISDGQYIFFTLSNGSYSLVCAGANNNNNTNTCYTTYSSSNGYGTLDAYGTNTNNSGYYSATGLYYGVSGSPGTELNFTPYAPVFSSISDGLSSLSSFISDPSAFIDSVGVKAFTPSGIADIPDTADPNYDALNRAKDIPLNIPWDDTIYGDGTGTLTDSQAGAIAGDLTQALETDRTVELVEESNPPAPGPDYSDVLLPLIPINVPSFNFSLSGIWHYVRSWVTSLGSWLSMMFSVWGILPYAIVVPVYACLVIVIVLGLYKRFFM